MNCEFRSQPGREDRWPKPYNSRPAPRFAAMPSTALGWLRWFGAGSLIFSKGQEVAMRMMLRWTVPVERGNETIEDGSLARTLEALMEELEPEAAYFWPENGERAGMMVFDMADPTQIPQIAEPLFLNLEAAVEFVPVMNADDLRTALEKVAAKG